MNSLDSTATFHIKGYRDMRLDWWSNHCTGGKHSPTAAIGVKLVNWIFINKSSIYTGLPAVQESLKSPGICKYFFQGLEKSRNFVKLLKSHCKVQEIWQFAEKSLKSPGFLLVDFYVLNEHHEHLSWSLWFWVSCLFANMLDVCVNLLFIIMYMYL